MILTIQNYSEIGDLNKLTSIVSKQMKFIGANDDPEKIGSAIKNALGENKRAIFFVKINDTKEYSGFAFCNISSGLESGADYIWINELYVEPEYRRKGVASEIMNFIENWAKENGIKYIATVTGKTNETAMGLYKKIGYELGEIVWVEKKIKSKR